MQHHFAFTHLKPENFTKSSNNDDTNKYCLNHNSQFFVLGKLKIFLVRQFIYFLIEFVIEQKKQPIIGYLNEDGKSNILKVIDKKNTVLYICSVLPWSI